MSKLLFLGDFFYDYNNIQKDIDDIASWINRNEYLVILNLEGPLSSNGVKIKKRGSNLSQSHITIDVLKKLNVIGVCLANNHIMDYDEGGLKETLALLDANGILHTGAGTNLTEALQPMVIELDECKVIIQNFGWDIEESVYATESTSGCAPRDEKIIINQTRRLKDKDCILVNVYHWGFEYNLYPMPFDIDLAHKSIDAGCDIIIGHHPHNIQPQENYKEKKIYYSLGNFYFSSRRERFNNRVFPGNIPDMCNYGAGIVYDCYSHQVTKLYIIYYNPKENKSEVIKMKEGLIKDITEVDYQSEDYIKNAKEYSINITPILTLNEVDNKEKLRKLYKIYKKAEFKNKFFKTIATIPFVKRFYRLIKKRGECGNR